MTETIVTGRNEPCPCGSGKKYKRCCGVNAAPKLTAPKNPPQDFPVNQEALNGMDPQMMMQFAQAFQRLPKGQLQRLQSIMQRAMSGKDVTSEAQEFEKSLPLDFQNLLQSMNLPAMAAAQAETSLPALETTASPLETSQPAMTEEEARALVAEAAEKGKISQEQASALLTQGISEDEKGSDSKFGKFWKNLSRKKSS